jgi:hypothetical protein
MHGIQNLDDPFYYLNNFHTVLSWTDERYSDLLLVSERELLEEFPSIPKASQALLVRMVMRKGPLFRASKLRYDEIGCPHKAAMPLVERGWVSDTPLISLEQLFGLLKKAELASVFPTQLTRTTLKKAEQLEALKADFAQPRSFKDWCDTLDDCIYEVSIASLCDRLRLMFFGNLYQDWSEFVLSDLGIFTYEKVEFSNSSRGFRIRQDVDDYIHIHACRERFRNGESPTMLLAELSKASLENEWLEARRAKLLFEMAYTYERQSSFDEALEIYRLCSHPGARMRMIRVLEKKGQYQAAFTLASQAECKPESDSESQLLMRMLPRLHRKLGLPTKPVSALKSTERIDLFLPKIEGYSVEYCVREHLSKPDGPVFYVENTLINGLLGLLCWDAIFAALPGAFFHPFHKAPADLHMPQFASRREQQLTQCFAQLDTGEYKETIRRNFRNKRGVQAPFIAWGGLTEEVLELALACLPPQHLRLWFKRILHDVKINRTGFPDLIQFWPKEQRYRMVEVKGPGDRLQDNQIRWLDYCVTHGMPVSVCYVQWTEPSLCNTTLP